MTGTSSESAANFFSDECSFDLTKLLNGVKKCETVFLARLLCIYCFFVHGSVGYG